MKESCFAVVFAFLYCHSPFHPYSPSPPHSVFFQELYGLQVRSLMHLATAMLPLSLLAAVLLPVFVIAQDGSISGPTSSPSAAGYSCDTTKCQLPNCNCASTSPPGGLIPVSLHLYPVCISTTNTPQVRHPNVHCFHRRRRRSILHPRWREPVPRTSQKSQRVHPKNDLLHLYQLY
jgi:hypothetical protein